MCLVWLSFIFPFATVEQLKSLLHSLLDIQPVSCQTVTAVQVCRHFRLYLLSFECLLVQFKTEHLCRREDLPIHRSVIVIHEVETGAPMEFVGVVRCTVVQR